MTTTRTMLAASWWLHPLPYYLLLSCRQKVLLSSHPFLRSPVLTTETLHLADSLSSASVSSSGILWYAVREQRQVILALLTDGEETFGQLKLTTLSLAMMPLGPIFCYLKCSTNPLRPSCLQPVLCLCQKLARPQT